MSPPFFTYKIYNITLIVLLQVIIIKFIIKLDILNKFCIIIINNIINGEKMNYENMLLEANSFSEIELSSLFDSDDESYLEYFGEW